jgi:hypothetical protein
VEAAVKQHQKVRLYFQIDPDFNGMEPSAMWEDFKLGVQDASRWERVALVTDIEWIRNGMKLLPSSFLAKYSPSRSPRQTRRGSGSAAAQLRQAASHGSAHKKRRNGRRVHTLMRDRAHFLPHAADHTMRA